MHDDIFRLYNTETPEIQPVEWFPTPRCTICTVDDSIFTLHRGQEVLHFCGSCFLDYMPDYHQDAITDVIARYSMMELTAINQGEWVPIDPPLLLQVTRKDRDVVDINDFKICGCCGTECYCFTIDPNRNAYLCPLCYFDFLPLNQKTALAEAVERRKRLVELRSPFA